MMKALRWKRGFGVLEAVGLSLWLGWAAEAAAAAPATGTTNRLVWDTQRNRVEADIQGWSLEAVLRQIAAQTGWKVWVEPGTTGRVSTRFQDLPAGEALRRLLDRLNFALLPQRDGPPHLYVFRTSLQDATQPVWGASEARGEGGGAERIRNEWIVRVQPGLDIEALARALGAEIVGRADGLHAYRLRFASDAAAEAARARLLEEAGVRAVDPNYWLPEPPEPQGVWSTSVVPPQVRPGPVDSSGRVVVALLDTPVQQLSGPLSGFLLDPIRVAGSVEPPADRPTHGTAMAETILRGVEMVAGADSKVRVLPVDIYGGQPVTSTFELAVGVYRAVREGGAQILNLSLGSEGDSPFLRELLQQVSRSGVLVVAAAGNRPVTDPVYPAAYPEVLAVTAGDRSGRIAPYANRGEFVDLVAPGASLVYFQGQPYWVSGTSVATAFVSGLAAGLAEMRSRDPREIQAALRVILSAPPRP